MHRLTLPLVVLALVALPLFAEKNIVGEKAPAFVAGKMINEVAEGSLEDCQGDVILIKYWGIN